MTIPLELTVFISPTHRHGPPRIQTTRSPGSPPGPGQCREIDSPLQTEAQRVCEHGSHHRLQRGNAGGEKEPEEHRRHRVGRRRAAEDAGALAQLPPGHRRRRVRGGQLRRGAPGGGEEGAGEHAEERSAGGPSRCDPRQQTGRERLAERH